MLRLMMVPLFALASFVPSVDVAETCHYYAHDNKEFLAAYSPGDRLDIKTVNGSIDVRVDPSLDKVKVKAEIRTSAITKAKAKERMTQFKLQLETKSPGVLCVRPIFPSKDRREYCKLTIWTPGGEVRHAASGNGAISLTGTLGPSKIQTSNGTITVKNMKAGDLDIKSSNGRITVTGAKGRVIARSGNGRLNVEGGTDIRLNTKNGRIAITKAAGQVVAHSGNGRISLDFAEGAQGKFDLKSSNGKITAKVPVSLGGRIAADTGNGSVKIENAVFAHNVLMGPKNKRAQIELSSQQHRSTINSKNGSIAIELCQTVHFLSPR